MNRTPVAIIATPVIFLFYSYIQALTDFTCTQDLSPYCRRQAQSFGEDYCKEKTKFGLVQCCFSCALLYGTGGDDNAKIASWTGTLNSTINTNSTCHDQMMPNGTSYTYWCEGVRDNPKDDLNCTTPPDVVKYLCLKTCQYCVV